MRDLQRGTIVRFRGEEYRFLFWLSDGTASFQHAVSQHSAEFREEELSEAFWKGEFRIIDSSPEARHELDLSQGDFRHLPERLQRDAERRLDYLRALEAEGVPLTKGRFEGTVEQVARRRGDARAPSRASLARWKEDWLRGGRDIRALVDHSYRRGGAMKLPAAVQAVIEDALDDSYLVPEAMTVPTLTRSIHGQIAAMNKDLPPGQAALPLPAESTVRRVIQRIDPYRAMVLRKGEKAAREKFAPVNPGHITERPLEMVLIDHSTCTVHVVDPVTGDVLGRPTLTIAIDQHTRMILGAVVTLKSPNYLCVGECLHMAIKPKDWIREEHPEIQGEWPVQGLPETVLSDRGKEFFSENLRRCLAQLSVNHDVGPPSQATFRAVVERFFGTIKRNLFNAMPGTTHSNIRERGDYPSEAKATFTLKELQALVHRWIVDEYHHTIHRDLKEPPIEVWKRGAAHQHVRLPARPEEVDALVLRHREATLSRRIQVNTIDYSGKALSDMMRQPKAPKKIDVYVDPYDLGHIWAVDPITRQHHEVFAVGQEFEGLTLEQYQAAQQQVRANTGFDNPRIAAKAAWDRRQEMDSARQRSGSLKKKRVGKIKGKSAGRLAGRDEPLVHEPARRAKGWSADIEPPLEDLPDPLANIQPLSEPPTGSPDTDSFNPDDIQTL